MTTSPSTITCSARRSPWQSRTRPASARAAIWLRRASRNAAVKRSAARRREGASAGGPTSLNVRWFSSKGPRRAVRVRACGGAMKLGDAPGDGVDLRIGQLATPCEAVQRALLGHAPHSHHVIESALSFAAHKAGPTLSADHGVDPQVVAGSKPAVEPHLLAAHRPAPLDGPVVEEREDHRLLELVRELPGQEHPRDVALAQLDALGSVRVEAGIEHRRDQLAGWGPGQAHGASDRGARRRASERRSSSDAHTITGK